MTELSIAQAPSVAVLVAANVRAEAARRGWNQVRLAGLLGLNQGSTSLRWRGMRSFSLDELGVIARAFGMSLGALVDVPVEAAAAPKPAD